MDTNDCTFLDGWIRSIVDATRKPRGPSLPPPPTYQYKDFEERLESAGKVPTVKKDNTLFYGAIAAGLALILATKV